MLNNQLKYGFVILIVFLCTAVNASINEYPKPEHIVVSGDIPKEKLASMELAARTYAQFWNTGDEKHLNAALSDDFIDLNLPEGRPQGKKGALFASANFRKAVPDLKCKIKQMLIVGNKVVSRLQFTGTFSGVFGDIKGNNNAINFSAVDIYEINNGKIVKNWHLEDNLSLMQQLGVVPMQ